MGWGAKVEHEGYIANLEIDEDIGVISGIVANVRATLHFQGNTVGEVRAALVDTIEDYRDWCASESREPEKPYSGILSLRLAPDLHRKVAVATLGDPRTPPMKELLNRGKKYDIS